MPNWPWYVWAIIGALFVMFVYPMLIGLVYSLMPSQGQQKGQ